MTFNQLRPVLELQFIDTIFSRLSLSAVQFSLGDVKSVPSVEISFNLARDLLVNFLTWVIWFNDLEQVLGKRKIFRC